MIVFEWTVLFMLVTIELCPFSYSFYLFAVPARTSWPEYQITIDTEAASDSDSGDESNSNSLVMPKHGKPDDLMQSWMDQFEVLNRTFSLFYTFANILLTLFIHCHFV